MTAIPAIPAAPVKKALTTKAPKTKSKTETLSRKPAPLTKKQVEQREKGLEGQRFKTEQRLNTAGNMDNERNAAAHDFSARMGDRLVVEETNISLHLKVALPAIDERLQKFNENAKQIQQATTITEGAKRSLYSLESEQAIVGIGGLFNDEIQILEKKAATIQNALTLKLQTARSDRDNDKICAYIASTDKGITAYLSNADACMAILALPPFLQQQQFGISEDKLEILRNTAFGPAYQEMKDLDHQINMAVGEFNKITAALQDNITVNGAYVDEVKQLMQSYGKGGNTL